MRSFNCNQTDRLSDRYEDLRERWLRYQYDREIVLVTMMIVMIILMGRNVVTDNYIGAMVVDWQIGKITANANGNDNSHGVIDGSDDNKNYDNRMTADVSTQVEHNYYNSPFLRLRTKLWCLTSYNKSKHKKSNGCDDFNLCFFCDGINR